MTEGVSCANCHSPLPAVAAVLTQHEHLGLCEDCAQTLARRSLWSLAHYGKLSPYALDLLDEALAKGGQGRNPEPAGVLAYRPDGDVGVLVAISRRYQRDTIQKHEEVLQRRGAVAFGKFLYSRLRPGDPSSVRMLSSIGRERHRGPAMGALRSRLEGCLGSRRPLQLLILDPDPPASLWSARISEVAIRTDALLGSPDFAPPHFRRHEACDVVPGYYWLEPQRRQNLKYHCNFWFLVTTLERVAAEEALWEMVDTQTRDPITLATAQLYPAEVWLPEGVLRADSPTRAVGGSTADVKGLTVDLRVLLDGASRASVTRAAGADLRDADQATRDQVADLLVRMARFGAKAYDMGIRLRPVEGQRGLMEFYIGDAARVVAGWAGGRWWIVGVSRTHPDSRWWGAVARRWALVEGH